MPALSSICGWSPRVCAWLNEHSFLREQLTSTRDLSIGKSEGWSVQVNRFGFSRSQRVASDSEENKANEILKRLQSWSHSGQPAAHKLGIRIPLLPSPENHFTLVPQFPHPQWRWTQPKQAPWALCPSWYWSYIITDLKTLAFSGVSVTPQK